MFSPRLFAVLFVGIVACAAVPIEDLSEKPMVPRPIVSINEEETSEDGSWFSFPLLGNPFAYFWNLFPSFSEIGPKIVSDDSKFQVIVGVKSYKKEDLKVKVKNDFIFVQGSHEGKQEDKDVFASQFFHTYSLPVNCSGADVTADLTSDGYLVVTAPINGPVDRSKETDREVTINETGAPYQAPKKENKPEPVPAAPVSEDSERKEPTTPSQREEITEKDNSIPHGNEVAL